MNNNLIIASSLDPQLFPADREKLESIMKQLEKLGWKKPQLGSSVLANYTPLFIELFNEQGDYIKGNAQSILEAAESCLAKAEQVESCPHSQLIDRGAQLFCPDCLSVRNKTAHEILNDFLKFSPGEWQLIVKKVNGREYASTFSITGHYELTDTTNIKQLFADLPEEIKFSIETNETSTVSQQSVGDFSLIYENTVVSGHFEKPPLPCA